MRISVGRTGTARHGRWFEKAGSRLAGLLRHEGGASAIEFAIIAPFLIFGLLSVVDLGLAIRQRMTMDHVLRAGMQSAMGDPGIENVLKILEATASQNFTVGSSTPSGGKPPITLAVNRYCLCPGELNTKVACSTICTGSTPTLAFYSLSASRIYTGMFVPNLQITFRPEVQVQVL